MLTDAIIELLLDKDKLERFSAYNGRLIRDKAAHIDQMRKMESLYMKVISNKAIGYQ